MKHTLTNSHTHTALFLLDPVSGELVLVASLDYEQVKQYSFNVTIMDRGFPPLNDTAEVHVTVTDENDNTPMFGADLFQASVAEGNYSLIGPFAVANVTALDPDCAVVWLQT